MLMAAFPLMYLKIRALVQPWALAQIAKGERFVVELQKRDRWGPTTRLCKFTGIFCNVEFYITFLPFLFWSGNQKLARSCTLLMATCIYSGNAIKDVVCAPRPSCPPVARIGGAERGGPTSTYGRSRTRRRRRRRPARAGGPTWRAPCSRPSTARITTTAQYPTA